MLSEDCELVERCLAGSESAYREFVDRHKALVYGVCVRMLGDAHEAEDAAQEVLVRALRGLSGWDASRPLRPWLLAIAANRCRTFLMRRKRRPTALEAADELPDRRPNDESVGELRSEIEAALSRLRAEYQQVFLLFHQHHLSYEEMSELTGKPVGTVKTWLHRARKEMLTYLRERGFVPEERHDLSKV